MKKLSTYFFTAVFFVGFYPKECDWPYPGDKEVVAITQQQLVNPIQDVEIIS